MEYSIWPIDLLNDLPFSLQIDAIDISTEQFPPREWLPEGMAAIAHDVYNPFPEHMVGKYDLVHIQNWLCVWRDETSDRLLQNLFSLLSKLSHTS